MTRSRTYRPGILTVLVFILLLGGCGRADRQARLQTPLSQPTATEARVAPAMETAAPTATAAATHTATATATTRATSTPTPTLTPLPLTAQGDLRYLVLAAPAPVGNAVCGLVDILDFPVNPPDGVRASGGATNFARYRGRYDKYHAGEDWGLASRQNFGVPVYSIGHGQVTYAEPLGWNADKGVVIIRHFFADGSTILSFYGHLDPPSVTLQVGDCVQRGQEVGRIGQPRTSPHLHFEIRSHMPDVPGAGYWATDPTQAGWEPPSLYIWSNRMTSSPGAQWVWSRFDRAIRYLGMLGPDTIAVLEGVELAAIDARDGRERWRFELFERVDDVMLSADGSLIYVAGQPGELRAYRVRDEGTTRAVGGSEQSPALLWELNVRTVGTPVLLPLPEGGVVVSSWREMIAVSDQGQLLWRLSDAPLADWLLADGELLVTTTGAQAGVWSIDNFGAHRWEGYITGSLVGGSDDHLFLYERNTIYRLDPAARMVSSWYTLPNAFPGVRDVAVLPDGGLLLAHSDRSGGRIIALRSDGTLRWHRAYTGVLSGMPRLWLIDNGQGYVLFDDDWSTSSGLYLYALDLQNGDLTHIFAGGTGNPQGSGSALFDMDAGRVLINIRDAALVMLEPRRALEAVLATVPIEP